MKWSVVLTGVILVIQTTAATRMEIFSDPALGLDLEEGLQALISGMTLLLQEGTHTLSKVVSVRDAMNVVIRGRNPDERNVVITCSSGVGLSFFNVSNLTIRNVTVRNCGLNRERWDNILPFINATVALTFEVPRDLNVGIVIAASTDVTLENVIVEDTRGIGLMAITLLGQTRLRRVQFHDNVSPRRCDHDIPREPTGQIIGGGVYILYQDLRGILSSVVEHSLIVEDSVFSDNRDCSTTSLIQNFIERSVELADDGYTVGAGGGLTVMMAQLKYAVTTNITRSEFRDNSAITGGGLHVGIFSAIPAVTPVYVSECLFMENGKKETVFSGGGMVIQIDLVRPAELRGELQIENTVAGGVLIDIERSEFTDNRANSGGGVAILSQYSERDVYHNTYRARFHECTFESNRAFGGSAMLVFEEKSSGFSPGLQLEISHCNITKNSQSNDNTVAGGVSDYGAVHVRNANVTLSGVNNFDRNLATALGSFSSLIYISGLVMFERNKAVGGAGMQLVSGSVIILQPNTHVMFIRNRAEVYGAAIYVNMNPDNFTFIPDNCFLYFNQLGRGICRDPSLCLPQNVTLQFRDNGARLGSIVYGSSLSTCPWVNTLEQVHREFNSSQTIYDNLRTYRKTIDSPPPNMNEPPEVSTPTTRLVVEQDLNLTVMPGVEFPVDVTAFDDFGHTIPEIVTSSVILGNGDDENINDTAVIIGDFGFFEVSPGSQNQAPMTVYSNSTRDVMIRLSTLDLQSEALLIVSLESCILGFTQRMRRCVCDERLDDRGIDCDVNFTVRSTVWLGPIYDGDDVTNDDLTVGLCVLNYCGDDTQEIASGDWDHRCRPGFHRTGRLCGRCEDGYSLQLGTTSCARCTNWHLFLLVFFILAGIFIVFVMGVMEISVSEGFFAVIVFYSNIITLYSNFFNNNNLSATNFVTAFLTLNFGIPMCFYNGLDSLQLVAIQLTFVAYLFILAVFFIVLAKTVTCKLSDYLHQRYTPAKTFATLIVLSYVSILQSSLSIFSFTIATTFDGKTHLWWYSDPTVDYLTGLHIFLWIVAAILLLLIIIPLPIFLTFFTKSIYRWPYFNKFKPLYDALLAPYKPKFRPWLGLQIIVRIVLFINAYFIPRPHLLLVAAVCLIFYLHLQTELQPYKVLWINRLETALMANALLIVIVTLYFGNLTSVNPTARRLTVIFLSALALVAFIYSTIRHIIERNPKTWSKIEGLFTKKENKESQTIPKIMFMDSSGNNLIERESSLSHKARSASVDFLATMTEEERIARAREFEVTFTEFREPLLDEGEVEVASSYSVMISKNSSGACTPTAGGSAQELHVGGNTLNLPVDNVPRNTA